MKTNETDIILKKFFGDQKQEITDNGFSRRVVQRLPEQKDRTWIVWVFALVGMTISLLLGISFGLLQNLMANVTHIPINYLITGVFCFPLVASAGYYFLQRKQFRLI
jgi:hypothetical protein